MLKLTDLKGVVVPLRTPLLKSNNKIGIDRNGVFSLVKFVIEGGVNILFPSGNADEGRFLDFETWSDLIMAVVNARNSLAGSVPVLAGMLRANEHEIVKFAKKGEELGADGFVLGPMYNIKGPLSAINALASTSKLPIILYNSPSTHNDTDLPFDIIMQAKNKYPDQILGLKESSTEFNRFKESLKLQSPTFRVFQGNTAFDIESLKLGALGIVPSEANNDPKLFSEIYKNFYTNESEKLNSQLENLLNKIAQIRSETGKNNLEIGKIDLVNKGIIKSSMLYTN